MTDIFGKNVLINKGCFIPTGRLLLSLLIENKLLICNLDGTKRETVHLDYVPHSVTLYDNEQALVTSCNGRFLQTVNLTTFKPGKNYISVQVKVQSPVQTGKYQNSFIMTNLHGDVLKKTTTKLDLFDILIELFFYRRHQQSKRFTIR